MAKYARLRERVQQSLVPSHALVVPDATPDATLQLVHDAAYVRAVTLGTLPESDQRRIGFPWSPGMVERSRRSVGGTLAASRAALEDGVSVNLAGGTHHAFPGQGNGFCVFNDVAVAARALLTDGRIRRAVVIDTDVHQGDGTAYIFRDDPAVFTFSVHGRNNFPFRKQSSDLDIDLPDGAGDDAWLAAVRRGLDAAFGAPAQVAFCMAGADPFAGDRLGRLDVSAAALAERDRMVIERCAHEGAAIVFVMGGGYAADIEDIVAIHFHTVASAARFAETGVPIATSR